MSPFSHLDTEQVPSPVVKNSSWLFHILDLLETKQVPSPASLEVLCCLTTQH